MAVNLSPLGGAAAQFFDNNGVPLVGGKLYTYVAGTTTPLAAYTSNLGTTAHTNPIILDAGGRVSGGEIWLSATPYKFSLQTSTDVLIATYDNISGIGVAFYQVENFTGTGAQTVFTLSNAAFGTNFTFVYVNGVYQNKNTYSVSGTTLTFSTAPTAASVIEIMYS